VIANGRCAVAIDNEGSKVSTQTLNRNQPAPTVPSVDAVSRRRWLWSKAMAVIFAIPCVHAKRTLRCPSRGFQVHTQPASSPVTTWQERRGQ
jgi:hypothetical protein